MQHHDIINNNYNNMLLKLGSNGEDVKKLQENLGLKPDGIFGKDTENAVKDWQSKNGLSSDGIVGPEIWTKILKLQSIKDNSETKNNISFKLENLRGHIPDFVISQIPETASKFNITNVLRLSHFLSQCGHESNGFKAVTENLNYSVDGLKKIFPKYFPGQLANSYARNPEKIASRVYGGRMGNGDESTKEGFKFRGRGYIQLTGKSNYTGFSKFIGEDLLSNPDLVATKHPLASAAYFFDSNKIWTICDKGATRDIIESVTKRVNGGLIGIEDRVKHFNEYYNLLK